MKAILASIVAAAVIAAGAAYVLDVKVQRRAYDAYSTPSTRVGDPGENLVGHDYAPPGQRAPQS